MTESWNFDLYIDGTWTNGESTGSIEVINPANEEVIGTVPEASPKDAVAAIEAARRAFDEGPCPTRSRPNERPPWSGWRTTSRRMPASSVS